MIRKVKMRRFLSKYWMISAALILLLGAGWIWISADPDQAGKGNMLSAPQAGFSAPEFTLETLQGESVSLSSLRGKPVILNFWASWCPPCRAEMPALENIHKRYSSEGLVVLAVNATAQDSKAGIDQFLNEVDISFLILMDPASTAASLYEIRSLPTTFFIDRQGTIRDVVLGGPLAEALLRSRAEDLLEKEP
jgi:thiol-disulfide isomerase/thioredoxin